MRSTFRNMPPIYRPIEIREAIEIIRHPQNFIWEQIRRDWLHLFPSKPTTIPLS
jgi:hypothetical protein